MEKYKLKEFDKWSKAEGLTDKELNKIVREMERGLLGDRLGAFVYKKRIGISGRGKRGGARTILIYKHHEVAVFMYGYSKNEKGDLEQREEVALRTFAKAFMELLPLERIQCAKEGSLIAIKETE